MSEQYPNQGRDDKMKQESAEPAAAKLETPQAATAPDTPTPNEPVSAFEGQSLHPIKEEDVDDIFEPEPLNEHNIYLTKPRKFAPPSPPNLTTTSRVEESAQSHAKEDGSVKLVDSVEPVGSARTVAAPTELTASTQSPTGKQAAIDNKITLEILSSSGVLASDVDSAINSARDLSWPLATILVNLGGKGKETVRDQILALREQRMIIRKQRRQLFMRRNTQLDNPDDDSVYSPAGSPTRLSKAPPPTPPELESRHHSLSLPTLPVFHAVSDAGLIEQYRAERELNPQAFDQRTHRIRMQHIAAKIGRGGVPRLVEGDYTVDLASREDAARAGKWGAPRHSLESDEEEIKVEEGQQDGQAIVTETPTEFTDTRRSKKSYAKAGPAPKSDPDENVVKYMVGGNLKTQKNFTSEKTEGGTKVTRTVYMKATEIVVVPEGQSTEWDDVLEALKTGKREHNFFPAAGEENPVGDDPEWEEKALEAEELLEHFEDLTENEILGATMSRLHSQIRAARFAKENTFPVG